MLQNFVAEVLFILFYEKIIQSSFEKIALELKHRVFLFLQKEAFNFYKRKNIFHSRFKIRVKINAHGNIENALH